jgi:hypothetical protein
MVTASRARGTKVVLVEVVRVIGRVVVVVDVL